MNERTYTTPLGKIHYWVHLISPDGTYMDRIEHRFTYNGTDTRIDKDGGGVKIVSFENVYTTYPEHTHIEPCVISGVRFFEIISVKR